MNAILIGAVIFAVLLTNIFDTAFSAALALGLAALLLFRVHRLEARLQRQDQRLELLDKALERNRAKDMARPERAPREPAQAEFGLDRLPDLPATPKAQPGSDAVAPGWRPIQPNAATPHADKSEQSEPGPLHFDDLAPLRFAGPKKVAETVASESKFATNISSASDSNPRSGPIAPPPQPVAMTEPQFAAANAAGANPTQSRSTWETNTRFEARPNNNDMPSWLAALLSLENWPIKVGMLLLLIGLGSGYRYLVDAGFLYVSIQMRLLGIAAAAIGALIFGVFQRDSKPTFALSLQGGALGALLMTIYAAQQHYDLISGGSALTLMLLTVTVGVLLALWQDAMWLALFAALGGFAAPILASTGGGSHVQLFSYYLILNVGLLAIALKKGWRPLNLLGAAATFGIGLTWGASAYQPEHFGSVEPFVIAFFLIYLAITVLYALRHGEEEPVLDGILVFGVPLATLAAQLALLAPEPKLVALHCLLSAALYAGLAFWLERGKRAELLSDCFLLLAVSLLTLAIPYYFQARWTSALWALEGAALVWLGLRQESKIQQLLGLALQFFAACAYMYALQDLTRAPAILNGVFAGALLIAAGAWLCAFLFYRSGGPRLALVLLIWGLFWWFGAGSHEIVTHVAMDSWPAAGAALVALTMALLNILAGKLGEIRLNYISLAFGVALPGFVAACGTMDEPWRYGNIPVFLALLASTLWSLRMAYPVLEHGTQEGLDSGEVHIAENQDGSLLQPLLRLGHLAVVLSVTVFLAVLLSAWGEQIQDSGTAFGDSWVYWLRFGSGMALAVLLLKVQTWVALPLRWRFLTLREDLLQLLGPWHALIFFGSCFLLGDSSPLSYIPVFNPLEILQLSLLALLWWQARETIDSNQNNGFLDRTLQRRLILGAGLLWISCAALRLVAHWIEPSNNLLGAFGSASGQAALALVWSVLGCGAMIMGNARQQRALWITGASLMGVVLVKLLLVDRANLGDVAGIVATLGVGALLAGVGYFAPVPPAKSS